MRVLAVIPSPTYGGAANQVLHLTAPLAERGFELSAVFPDEPGNAAARLEGAGLSVHRLPMRRLRNTRAPGPHLALARHAAGDVRRLRRLVRRTGAGLVMNHGDLNPQAGIAGHLEGAAVNWQLLDTRTPVAVRRVTMQLVRRLADSVATVGHELARVHPGARELGERCVTIFPPVVQERFEGATARRAEARRELDVPEDAFVVGAIGNRNPQKGHDHLIRATAALSRRHPGTALRILGALSPGHDEYERGLHAAAAEGGLAGGAFAAVDPGTRVPELIGAFDVLCMPSVPNSEGIPTVILEAMAAGIPVVATDVGAVREVVESCVSGLVVAPSDDDALAAALARLAGDPELRARLGAAGRERARAFSLESLADAYARAYELAIEHRRGRRRHAALDRATRAR